MSNTPNWCRCSFIDGQWIIREPHEIQEYQIQLDEKRGLIQDLTTALENRNRKLAEAKAAIVHFFASSPGVAVPEPFEFPSKPMEITWNEKLARLKAIVKEKP